MRVALLNVQEPGDNKDYNGGFGTTWQIGDSFLSKILEKLRSKGEYFPLMSYGYLASILKKNGHEVKYFENELPSESDLVLVHVSPIRFSKELEFLKRLKEDKFAKVGVFGPFASVKPDLFLDYADFVICGEPEQAVMNIIDKIPEGVIHSAPIMDLDSLPYPDWSIFPYGRFSCSFVIPKKPFMFIQGSRGCPYTCSYCPYKVFGTYRSRDPLKVVDEIEYLRSKYNVNGLMFRDPMFSLSSESTKVMAREIIRRGIDIEWGCETRLDRLDKGLLDLLFDSGLRAIKVGIESVSDEVLQNSKRKTIEKKHQEEIISYCNRKGIRVVAFYIVGLPDDTEQTVLETIKYSRKLNTDFANFTLCTPIPGTPFFDDVKSDLITDRWEEFDNFHVVFRHKHLSKERLLKLQEDAITGYYFRPRFIMRHLLRKLTR